MFFVIGAGAIITSVSEGSQPGSLLIIALAHGLALAVAVSAFGAISGGHFNPAVTFGLFVAGKHPSGRVLSYWAAQLIGGLVAGVFLLVAFQHVPSAVEATHLGTPGLAAGVS